MARKARMFMATALLVGGVGGCRHSVPTTEAHPGPLMAHAALSPGGRARSCARGRAFVIVRHGEKASSDKDTVLSPRGEQRARAIAAMLAPSGVTRLVATQYKRTQQTLEPLAERAHLTIDVRDAGKTAELVEELRAAPDGSVIVIASHSNVLPALVEQLAGRPMPGVAGGAIADDDYRRVVVVTDACGAEPYMIELSSDVAGAAP